VNRSTHIRRDPQKGKKGFSRLTGFTIIEMMTVLAVLAIITSFAIPSYTTLLDKRRVTSGSVQIASFLTTTQVEAVKRGEQIAVNYDMTDKDTWCIGLISGDNSCDCKAAVDETNACLIDGQLRVFSQASVNNPAIMNSMSGGGDDDRFVFDPIRGLLVDHTDAFEVELESAENIYALNVQVSISGRVRICSDNSTHKVPGYDEC
jgi:prepilin-type N-terminal cleavage/methylation domain-containing protein